MAWHWPTSIQQSIRPPPSGCRQIRRRFPLNLPFAGRQGSLPETRRGGMKNTALICYRQPFLQARSSGRCSLLKSARPLLIRVSRSSPMTAHDQLEPTVFVIFGGAGDLTWRKLVPALFDLSQDRSMPAQFAIIAVDRVELERRQAAPAAPRWRQEILAPRQGEGRRVESVRPTYPLPAGRFQEAANLYGPGRTMREAGKGMGHQSPSHLLHGHTAEHVRRNPEIPRQGRTGARPGMGADCGRETDRL